MIGGRRALSKKDVNMVMLGMFNPENHKNLVKDNRSGLKKSIEQINRELGTFYKVDDFINLPELNDIRNKWNQIPLGLSDIERQKYLDMPIESKLKEVLEPALKEREKLIEDQQEFEQKRIEEKIKRIEKTYEPKAQLPASPFIPDVDATVTASLAPVVDQTTGLTRTESALLSPSEKVIAQRSNQGIMGLV